MLSLYMGTCGRRYCRIVFHRFFNEIVARQELMVCK